LYINELIQFFEKGDMKITDSKYLEKICDNIYLLLTPTQGQFPYCNSFLFTGNENILIDAGADKDVLREIDRDIRIDTLIISHSHPDHIRSWDVLSHRKLLLPAETPDSVYELEELGERYTGTPERGYHWIESIGKMLDIHALRKPDGRFSDNDIISNGSVCIEAIYTPGHLADHYCFFEHESGTLFSSDINFSSFGPWYGNPEGRIKPFIKSVERVMSLPYRRICTSHNRPHEGDATALFMDFLNGFESHKKGILKLIDTGKTLHEIVTMSPFYHNKYFNPVVQYSFEENMTLENLKILMEEGRVYEKEGRYMPV